VKRKKTVLALSLTIPLLLEGGAATAASATGAPTYPAADYPPGETTPTTTGPDQPLSPLAGTPATTTPTTAPGPAPGGGAELPDTRTSGGLPVTGGDLAGLAVVGIGAVAVGFGLNSAADRRRYGGMTLASAPGVGAPPLGSGGDGVDGPETGQDVRPRYEPAPFEGTRSESEGLSVANEHQFRIAPEALEREDILEGVDGPVRERLAAVLQSAASSYRATLEELEQARHGAPAAEPGERTDGFAELGDHVAWVLRASHDAAEEERRRAREEVEAMRAEAALELTRRRDEVDELERRAAERLRLADDEATTTVAAAREEAERQSGTIRADAEAQLSSLLQLQESLRVQLVEASQELRRSLDSLGAPEAPAPPPDPA
jgi:hypothetical protein